MHSSKLSILYTMPFGVNADSGLKLHACVVGIVAVLYPAYGCAVSDVVMAAVVHGSDAASGL